MIKPLVGLIAIPILAVWLLVDRRPRELAWLLVASAIALALATPWHLSMVLIHGDTFTAYPFDLPEPPAAALAASSGTRRESIAVFTRFQMRSASIRVAWSRRTPWVLPLPASATSTGGTG